MAREIKFRVWYPDAKKMYLVEDYNLGECLVYKKNHPERIEIMQFTGVKDMHGDEIYEGDILHWPEYAEDEDAIHTEDFEWTPEGYQGKKSRENITDGECEIIGNIYENPELLKEVKNG